METLQHSPTDDLHLSFRIHRTKMYRATMKYRGHSRIDRENVASKVNEWKSRHEIRYRRRRHPAE